MSVHATLLYWEARARELERRLRDLRARWVALIDALPPEALELLELEPRDLDTAAWSEPPVRGLESTHDFLRSDVETELAIVWRQLRRGGEPDG